MGTAVCVGSVLFVLMLFAAHYLPIVCIDFEVPRKLINCIFSSVDRCPQNS